MNRMPLASLLLLPMLSLAAPLQLTAVPESQWEAFEMVRGVVDEAFSFGSGANAYTLVLSRTGNFLVEPDEGREQESARLYSTLLRGSGDTLEVVWRTDDGVDPCPLQITAEFTEPAAFLSDADGDGEPEVWVAHRLACRIDVSPANQQLVGHEGEQTFVLQGSTRISMDGVAEGGDAQPDAALRAAPKLLKHAQQLWSQIRDEAFE